MKLVVLKEFLNSAEAKIAQLHLQSEGITSSIFNESIDSIFPFFNSSIGGVTLKVLEQDLERSKEIIQIEEE